MATSGATPSTSTTPPPSKQENNSPVAIAAAAGGGLVLLIMTLLVAFLLIRRNRKRNRKVLLRGRQSKISPGPGGGSRVDIPLRYPTNIMTTLEGSQPSLSRKPVRPLPQIPRQPILPQEGASSSSSRPTRPTGIHGGYPSSPYTASALEKAYEILERNVTSPIPSFISGRTDGAVSGGVASPQPSSDLNHGRSFRSLDQPPLNSTPNPLFSQASDAVVGYSERPRKSGSTRGRNSIGGEHHHPPPPPTAVRRPSEVKRAELLAALYSTEVVAVVRRPSPSSGPSTASDAPAKARDRYRPP